jgi:hypothetical protein
LLGAGHAIWHLPLMDRYGTTLNWYLFNVIPPTCIFNRRCLCSSGSVLLVALFHAGTNVIGSFPPPPVDVLSWGIPFMPPKELVHWILALLLILRTRGKFGWKPAFAKGGGCAKMNIKGIRSGRGAK